MKLFISWSGQPSQQIANELRKWFPLILPAVKPFITTTDIEKGAQWQGVIRDDLEKSSFGLVVLTRENLDSQWIAFEAGALSKHLSGRVATVLFGIGHSDIKAPLRIFQGTIFGEEEFQQLIGDINEAVEPEHRRGEDELNQLFPMLWLNIEKPVKLLLEQHSTAQPAAADQPPDYAELAQEMMALLRQQNLVLASPEKFFAPLVDELTERLSTWPPRRRVPSPRDYENIPTATAAITTPSEQMLRALEEERFKRADALREVLHGAEREREREAQMKEEIRLARIAQLSKGGQSEGP